MIYIFTIATSLLIAYLILSLHGPPLILIAIGFQFSQVSLRAFQSLIMGEALTSLSAFGTDIEPAIYLGASGLTMLTLGVWLGAKRSPDHELPPAIGHRQLFVLAMLALAAGHVFSVLQFSIPPAQQLLLGLSGLRYAGLFLIVLIAINDSGKRPAAIGIAMFELGLGFMGFFGAFRIIFYVIFGAFITSWRHLSLRSLVAPAIICFCALLTAIFWSHTKVGYRALLNQGTSSQVVLVPISERFDYLVNALYSFSSSEFQDGLGRLLDRITYVDHMAVVLTRVPNILPHTNGERTIASLLHVLVPRLLYPSKPPLKNDTEDTNLYTGLHDDWSEGTSISMGYLTELYIDFGYAGSLVAMLFIGLVFGIFYRKVRDFQSQHPWLNQSFCMMLVLPFAVFETALVKLVGSLIVTFISVFILQRWAVPFILKWLGRISKHSLAE